MPATPTKFKPTTRTGHAIFSFFHGIYITFAAFDFPGGILAQLLGGNIVVKCVGHCLECAAPSTDSNGGFKCFYLGGTSLYESIHSTLAVIQEINAARNVIFVLGSFLKELHCQPL